MKSHKQLWIATLCLLSAIAVALAFTVRTTKVQAARHVGSKSPASLAQPAVYLASPALRNAMLADSGPPRVSGNLQANPILPPVEEFTLTPPNPEKGIMKTTLNVRFAGSAADKLASKLPIMLGTQRVDLQRSPGDPRTFVTFVDFDWQAFAKEQAQRKEAAAKGRMVPVFEGRRFVRTEKMQFVDPARIQGALQSHQPIQFSPHPLTGGTVTVYPDHELTITALPVVEDSANTWDPCTPQSGTRGGIWTFAALMEAIACSGNSSCTPQTTQLIAEQMLNTMLFAWQGSQTVNNGKFSVAPRLGIGSLQPPSGLLGNWPIDSSVGENCTNPNTGLSMSCPSLLEAPVHLNAIVNRLDLGQNGPPFAPAGELRFVFGVTTNETFSGQPQPCLANGADLFNIILEYKVPWPGTSGPGYTAAQWADLWSSLPIDSNDQFLSDYLGDLESLIINKVVALGACTDSNGNPISCLSQIRTNEVVLGLVPGDPTNGFWEQRQFMLVPGQQPTIAETTISMTPDGSFNFGGAPACGTTGQPQCNVNDMLANYVNANQTQILETNGALPIVQDNWQFQGNNVAFLGGSAFNSNLATGLADAYWNDSDGSPATTITNETARIYFSQNTCNGCHGAETETLKFQQVVNRPVGTGSDASSTLSNFLLGCTDGTCTHQNSQQCALSMPNLGEQQGIPCTELVTDPTCNPTTGFHCNIQTSFGDIARRVLYFQTACGEGGPNNCSGDGGGALLLPFLQQPIGVH